MKNKHKGNARALPGLSLSRMTYIHAMMALLVLGCGIFAGEAQANLLISPTRVLMTERDRTTVVTVANPTTETRTYRIEWLEQRMNENGTYEPINATNIEGQHTLSSMIRYSPRRVTIAPGEYQKVRLSMRAPKGLETGEYRSHLLFKAEAMPTSSRKDDQDVKGAQIELKVNLSFSIPVIYHHGKGDVAVSIEDIALQNTEKGDQRMVLMLSRQGSQSSFGEIGIFLRKARSVKEERIGTLRSVAVFADSKRRRVEVPLTVNQFSSGDIVRVIYQGDDEYTGRVWDEKSFKVGR